jgi:HSP20 family protein
MRKTSNIPSTSGSRDQQPDQDRVPAQRTEGTERTRGRPVYAPRVDIVETDNALEVFADMPGVTKDSIEIMLEQRVLRIQGVADISLPEGVAPLYLEYQPGDYERAFTLSNTVDPSGIEARIRNGVLHLRLPKTGPAQAQRIEVRAD